jgi:probable F420-dependent oxidoreductase
VERPFRFGLHFWELPVAEWVQRVRRYEELGFSTITFTDHTVVPQWDPLAGLSAIAAVTERIGLGTLVLDAGRRNPVLTAKAASTVERISGGRLELGLGAGYVAANFAASGLPFEPAPNRVGRLEETVPLLRSLWTASSTTVRSAYFEVTDAPMASSEPVSPRVLIGGGGSRVMHLGGRVADTVSMIPRQTSGSWSVPDSLSDSTLARMVEKASWVREGALEAGRDPESVELNTMVFKVIVGDDPRSAILREAETSGVPLDAMVDSTLYLCGTGDEVCDQLRRWRDQAGISYVSLFDPGEDQVTYLAERVVAPLSSG